MLVCKPRKPEGKHQLAIIPSARTIITCERGLLRSPKDVVGSPGWSLYIEQTFQSAVIVGRCDIAPTPRSPCAASSEGMIGQQT